MKTTELHYNTRLPLTIETLRGIWEDWTDSQRLEVIKSLIWTAPDMHAMFAKVQKLVNDGKFELSLD